MMKEENLVREKSFNFALEIIKLYKFISFYKKEFVLSKQVLRSGTSIGENINPVKYYYKDEHKMYYVYVLQSLIDKKFYTGYTKNLKQRFEQHQKGKVKSTENRRPLKLIYYEFCLNQEDAIRREKYLKTYYGKAYLKKRLKCYLAG